MTYPTPTPSLFEREMHHQLEAAQAALAEAVASGDELLQEAVQSQLDGLISLARRNGMTVEEFAPEQIRLPDPGPDATDLPEALPA